MVDRLLSGESLIRVWREYRGLDVATLAVKADIDSELVAQVEAGERTLSEAELTRIATALNLTIDDLI